MEDNQPVIIRNHPSSQSAQGEVQEEGNGKEECVHKNSFSIKNSKSRATREELDQFCRESGLYPRDAEYLWNRWESNGWKNGRESIKDWKATIRSWKAQGYMPSQKNPMASDCWPESEALSSDEPELDLMATLTANLAKQDAAEQALGIPHAPEEGDEWN